MLLPHGIDGLRSEFEYKTIFPTRTIPLLFSGKPILAHSPEGSFLNEFLYKNQCAVIVAEKNKQKLLKACHELIGNKGLRLSLVENAFKASSQFELKEVANKILEY